MEKKYWNKKLMPDNGFLLQTPPMPVLAIKVSLCFRQKTSPS